MCGDGNCEVPGEYPYFKAHHASREFEGCKKDCSTAETVDFQIDFFDPWKLQTAYDQVSGGGHRARSSKPHHPHHTTYHHTTTPHHLFHHPR